MGKRTIIDILKTGNVEMFHSRMIAWLLDPISEHGYGDYFIKEFAKVVDSLGNMSMVSLIKNGNLTVSTEKKEGKYRYDIVIENDEYKFIIENKVKSLGNDLQLDLYQAYGEVVGLGFIDVSFAEGGKYPKVKYKDILNIISNRPRNVHHDPYEVLITQYQEYLQKELDIVELMRQTYFGVYGSTNGDLLLNEIESRLSGKIYNDNDIRFLNYAYLEYLRSDFDSQVKQLKWTTNKDMISGPWLSSWQDWQMLSSSYKFNNQFIDRYNQFGIKNFWFHVQIEAGVAQKDANAVAGKLQLKTASNDTKAWCDELKKIYQLRSNQSWCKRVSKNEFYIVEEPFTRNDLHKDIMAPKVKTFMECFGKFY